MDHRITYVVLLLVTIFCFPPFIVGEELEVKNVKSGTTEVTFTYPTNDDPIYYSDADWSADLLTVLKAVSPHTAGTGNIVEVGAFEGRGTNLLANYMLREQYDTVNNPRYKIFVFDVWDDGKDYSRYDMRQVYPRFLHNTKGIRNRNVLHYIRGFSNQTLPLMLPVLKDSVSFAYIDGDHKAEPTYLDAKNVFPMLRIGGYILFDDYLGGNYTYNIAGSPKAGIDKFINEYQSKIFVHHSGYQLLLQKLVH